MRIKFLHNFFPDLRRALEYFVLGWKDYDYDYASMFDIEEKKVKHMIQYFQKHGMTVSSSRVARDLELLLSIIHIIREGGNTYNIHPNKDEDGNLDFTYEELKRVNVRNASRFFNEEEMEIFKRCTSKDIQTRFAWQEELYLRKAVHLYCKLKEERMLSWAD